MWWQTQPISLSEMMPELHQSTDNCKHLDSARPEKAVLQFYSVEIHVLSICVCKCPCILCFVECLAYSCFTQLMKRMSQNFPNGGAMDAHFANMRSLIQVMDHTLDCLVCFLDVHMYDIANNWAVFPSDLGLWALWVDASKRRLHSLLLLLPLVSARL